MSTERKYGVDLSIEMLADLLQAVEDEDGPEARLAAITRSAAIVPN